MKHFYDRINLLVIPSDFCNLRCEYCFHNEYISMEKSQIMGRETIERLFYISLPHYNAVNFIWHGGEPLTMDLSFYQDVVKLQEKHNVNHAKITNSVQTNLTLMSDEYARFFRNNNSGISSSYDGIINDNLRHNTDAFFRGKQIWEKSGGKCGVIMVISQKNVHTLIDSYEDFKRRKISYIMNPYTKSLLEETRQSELEISGTLYAEEVIKFFDYWINDKSCNIYVKYFHELIDYMLFGRKSKCNVTSCLGKWLCVRPNGSITPCNRYFPEEYLLGNIANMHDIGEAFYSDGFQLLLSKAIERRNKCRHCEIFEYCSGGCNNIALVYGGIENNNNDMCMALKTIYKYVNNSIKNLLNSKPNTLIEINPFVVRSLNKYKAINGSSLQ